MGPLAPVMSRDAVEIEERTTCRASGCWCECTEEASFFNCSCSLACICTCCVQLEGCEANLDRLPARVSRASPRNNVKQLSKLVVQPSQVSERPRRSPEGLGCRSHRRPSMYKQARHGARLRPICY
jgi:hypothetical protein